MADVGRSPDTGSDQDHPGLLGRHGDPACPALCAGEVALAIGAEAAEVAEREVKGLVLPEQDLVPGAEGGEGRERGGAHRFIPFLPGDRPDRDTEIPEVCKIGM